MKKERGRIPYLDGLRGVAISLVVGWHFFGSTYTAWLPYGTDYADISLVRFGWMGVELFFLISGFVIFMTIEKCANFADFMIRRWHRLFPAILIATALIVVANYVFDLPGPYWPAPARNIIPGLTLLPANMWAAFLRAPVESLDGVFWTLYTEVAFYAVFGALYFWLGWKRAIVGLLLLCVVTRAAQISLPGHHAPGVLKHGLDVLEWFKIQYFGWFAAGALFFRARQDNSDRLLLGAIATGLFSAALFHLPDGIQLIGRALLATIVLAFSAVQKLPVAQRVLSTRLPLFIGAISYPLYLVHNRLGLGLLAYFAKTAPAVLGAALAALAIGAIVALAWLITAYAEPVVSGWLRPLTRRARAWFTKAA